MSQGARDLAQGRKGTGKDKVSIGIQVEAPGYAWLESRVPGLGNNAAMTVRALEDLREIEDGLGQQLKELRAMAILEGKSTSELVVEILSAAIDARKGGKKR